LKKLILLLFLVMSMGLVHAELEVDIPFDMDIIGDDFSVVGPYIYESDWITISNVGSTNETYTITCSFSEVPADWTASVCNELGLCYIPNMPSNIDINAGEFVLIHLLLGVNSTGGCGVNITLDDGDLTEPISLDFRFDTADNVSADEELIPALILGQNYPNPFNPSTTISYNLSTEELANASISIYNTKGQLIRTFNDLNTNGSIIWDGKDDNNNIVNSGVYFYKLNSIKSSKIRKMILIK
jgi:hypothetical protein